MSSRRMNLLGVFGIVGILIALVYLAFQPFPIFRFAPPSLDTTLSGIDGNLWFQVSQTLWTERQIDLVILAYLLLITAGCCRLLLIPEAKA